jgi:two-component system, cell cycle response regulator
MRRSHSDRSETVASDERLAALEHANAELTARIAALTEAAARNEAVLRKTQERELDLVRADTLVQLLERLIHGLKSAYQLDAVSLVLHDPHHEIRHLLAGDGFLLETLPEVQFVEGLIAMAPQLAALERPWLGPYHAADHALLLPHGAALGSIALIPLLRGAQLDGLLVFGSTDRQRFTRELASDFLAHLGVIAAVCVENSVNRARLLRSGLTDFLTGFHNRRYLHARLSEELARAQRAHQSVACLMIDVDHFKRINDRYGHLAGDAVLREVAQRIDAQMRTSDTGARFGGDEFAIVLTQCGVTDGTTVAQRTLQLVCGTPISIAPAVAETVTLSIGVAVATPEAATRDFKSLAERLMAEADAALYRAKGAGRNAVAVSERIVA